MLEQLPLEPTEQLTHEQATRYAAIEALNLAADPVQRAEQIANNTTAEGIVFAITGLHTGLAPEISHEPSDVARTVFNPNTGEVSATLLQPVAREPLFAYASELIRTLGQTIQPGQEQAYLDRAANVLALSIVLAHMFEDGNGRTARTLAHAVRYGSDITANNQDDYAVVSANRPKAGFKIDSYVPTKKGVGMSPTELITQAVALDIPLDQRAQYQASVYNHFSLPYSET